MALTFFCHILSIELALTLFCHIILAQVRWIYFALPITAAKHDESMNLYSQERSSRNRMQKLAFSQKWCLLCSAMRIDE